MTNEDESWRKPILTGRAWKAGGKVHIHFPAIWKALEAMKRQDGLGTSPNRERRPERPYDSGTDSDTNSDRESLDTTLDDLDSFLKLEVAGRLGGCTSPASACT